MKLYIYIYIYIYIIFYYIIVKWVMKLFRAYANYDDFPHANFIFSQDFISLFWGLFSDKTDFKVKYHTQKIMQI